MKTCYKCSSTKEDLEFSKNKTAKDGLNTWCKSCIKQYTNFRKEKISNYKKEHYKSNKEKYLIKSKNWKKSNSETYKEYLKEWRKENPEYNQLKLKEWFGKNPNKRSEYWSKLRSSKPHYIAWRNTLRLALHRLGSTKECHTIELLGYSPEDLKLHMESLFREGMSWDNWGEWHIDHIIPVSKFDKDTPMNIVNALCNLQPLWAEENVSKNNKIL